jgi:hypothetical protein
MSSPGKPNLGDFTGRHSDCKLAKISYLEWLQEEARKRGYDPEIDYDNRLLYEEPYIILRTRASVHQHSLLKFKVNDEVNADVSAFENTYSIVLDLQSRTDFDPSIDDFYPLTLTYYRAVTDPDRNGDYPIGVELTNPRVKRDKNSVDYLFPPESSRTDASDSDHGPDDSSGWNDQMSDRTRRLNEIFQDIAQDE